MIGRLRNMHSGMDICHFESALMADEASGIGGELSLVRCIINPIVTIFLLDFNPKRLMIDNCKN